MRESQPYPAEDFVNAEICRRQGESKVNQFSFTNGAYAWAVSKGNKQYFSEFGPLASWHDHWNHLRSLQRELNSSSKCKDLGLLSRVYQQLQQPIRSGVSWFQTPRWRLRFRGGRSAFKTWWIHQQNFYNAAESPRGRTRRNHPW